MPYGFFIPPSLERVARDAGATLKPDTIRVWSTATISNSYRVSGFRILRKKPYATQKQLDSLMERLGLSATGEGTAHGLLFTIYAAESKVTFDIDPTISGWMTKYPLIDDDVRKAVHEFSRITDQPVTLHITRGGAVPPYEDDRFHIVINGWPAGDAKEIGISRLFNTYITEPGRQYSIEGPARGRGGVVRDREPDGAIFAQVIDRTAYLFLPWQKELFSLYGGEGNLFRRSLATVWNAVEQGTLTVPEERVLTDPNACQQTVYDFSAAIDDEHKRSIKRVEAELKDLEEQYLHKLAELRSWRAFQHGDALLVEERERMFGGPEGRSRAWKRLLDDPLVEKLAVVEDGYHLTTTPITIEHGGKRYPLGRFVIRASLSGNVTAWCLDSTHPRRIAHPHLSETGTVCFGNITLRIKEEAIVFRDFAKVFGLALEWLVDGYEPSIASHKIEEWPSEEVRA